MRVSRWVVVLVALLSPALATYAAAPVSPRIGSGSTHRRSAEPPVRLLASDASGVTVEMSFDPPRVERLEEPVGRVRVSMDRAVPSTRVGYPELPVERFTIGVPHGTTLRARAMPGPAKEVGRYRVVPTPTAEIRNHASGTQYAEPKFLEDSRGYGARGYEPASLVEVVSDGLTRDRRTVTVEVRPVQYDPSSRRLRAYSRITVRVDFAGGRTSPRVRSRESEPFAEYFDRHLLNDHAARAWRAPAAPAQDADAAAAPPPTAVKLFVSKESVVRVDGHALAAQGIDLAQVAPRNLGVTFLGAEQPIYVHGSRDGRFDPDDYVEFLAARPTNPYSRYSVYLLAEQDQPGLRVSELEGAPRESLATLVPNFRSRVHFEKDLEHSLLQTVTSTSASPGDPHGWYEARDHWFWFGVKNGVERNEAALEFAVYDVAQTFDLGRIDVMLQGGTPVDHDVILSLNEVKLGRAKWADQQQEAIGRSVRIEDLVDAADGMNTMRLVRVDTNEDDDTDKYPFRSYVNWFDLEYTRDFRAVGDLLFASTPPNNKPLENRRLRTLEYSISDFLGSDIAVYEHNGKNLVSRFRNVEVQRTAVTDDARDRLHGIQTARGEPLSTPTSLYAARFQAQDTHDAKYIAVSGEGASAPDRIELDSPSSLKSSTNGADYVVIYHRAYEEAALRLAEWRSTPTGGGLRAKAVDVADVYDEFGHGMTSPWAIKEFLRHAFVNWRAPALSYVTIMADGTYDMFGVDQELYPEPPDVMGFIPTHYVWTLFGQTASDHWYTTVSGIDPLPDFFLGRLPVERPEEATSVVNKIIAYEGSPRNGSWRRQIISVADDDTTNSGDFIFKKSLTEVSQNHTLLGYVTNKIFLEDIFEEFPDEEDTSRVRRASQLARQRIVDSLSEGALIAQYAGHGGRLVWAHEIIFDNSGIRTLRPTDRLSLMFVLSCNNGYFDAPAEPSMGELMLRMEDAGIIGMLAATRLTFGSGNDALNKLIFDDIFGRNVRSFGEIAFHPKTRLMVEQGLTHLEVMQQYSLFGDPATKLHVADYEIRPEVTNRSVTPGAAVTTQPGEILSGVYDRPTDTKTFTPVSDFNGRLFVTAQFTPRGGGAPIERAAEAAVTAGKYPSVSLDVPANAASGRAQIEFFAESADHIAVGGATFALSEPIIEDVVVEDLGDVIGVAVRVTDDRGIGVIEFEHYDDAAREWVVTPMQRDAARGAGWYSLPENLPMPPHGESFEYFARAVDTDGAQVETRVATEVFHPLPDWRVLRSDVDRAPLITYQFDDALGWHISVTLENVEDVRTDVPVPVSIYEGNPDLDNDDIPDASAALVGKLTVPPDSWVKGDPLAETPAGDARLRESDTPLNTHWLGSGTLRTTLDPGEHFLFAWIDPPTTDGVATLEESDRRDNVDSVKTLVAEARVQGAGVALESVDRGLRVDIAGRAYPAPRVVGVADVDPAPIGQASLTALPAPGAAAHSVAEIDGDAPAILATPATVEARFDLTAFRQELQSRIGGEDGGPAIPPEVVRNELATAGLYEWLDDIERWRRLPDTVLLADAQQELVTRPGFTTPTQPPFDPSAADVLADEENAEGGRWIAMFTDPFSYDLYLQGEDGTLTRRAERVPTMLRGGSLPPDRNALPHIITVTNAPVHAYGDVLRVDVALPGQGTPGPVSSARRGNAGRGVVQILDAGSAPEDAWCLLFLNATQYEVRRRSWDALTARPATPVVSVGQAWTDPESGARFRVLAGATRYGPGDSLVFASHELGVTRATTDRLGTFAAFVTTDVTAPAIDFAVAGQDFADGDPVAPTPEFHAAISDDSGVHPDDLTLEISADGGEYVAVDAEDLRAHVAPGTTQLTLNYTPTLDPADYALRATVLDLDGNRVVREVGFRVTSTSILRSVLNYPNPFRTITDIGIEATGEMEALAVTVYSLQGRVVWRADHPRTAGFVRVRWDGRDTEGRDVANGVYYAKVVMSARGETHTDVVKMLKMK